MRQSNFSLTTGCRYGPIIRCTTVSIRVAATFTSRGASELYKMPDRAILPVRGMTTMSEMRTLFDALLVLSVLVAAGTVLGVMFR